MPNLGTNFFQLLVEFVCPGCDFGGHFGDFVCLGPHLDPKRAQGPKMSVFPDFRHEKVVPLGGFWGTFSALFFLEPPGH